MNISLQLQNVQILKYLNDEPGRLQSFLLDVPISELRNALQKKQRSLDLVQKRQCNKVSTRYKQNVLNLTLQEVIKANYSEKIMDLYQCTCALNSSTWQNHPQYGIRLVSKNPEKYYIGKRSGLYNYSREIQQLYGIERSQLNQNNNQIDLFSRKNLNNQDQQKYYENYFQQEKRQQKQQKNQDDQYQFTGQNYKKQGNQKACRIRKNILGIEEQQQLVQNKNEYSDYSDQDKFWKIQQQFLNTCKKNYKKSVRQIANEKLRNLVLKQQRKKKKTVPNRRRKMVVVSSDDD